MGGGGSVSAPNIAPRSPSKEKDTLANWEQFQQGQLNNYIVANPLVGAANKGALGFYNQVGGLTNPLQQLLGSQPGQYAGLQNQLGGLFGQGQGVFGKLGALERQTGALETPLQGDLGMINQVVRSGGALPPALLRDAQQQQLGLEAGAGTAHTTPGLSRTLLNSDEARQQRYQQYLANQQGVTQQLSGLVGQRAGITGQQGGILGLLSGITGQKGGLLGQQASSTGALTSGIQNLQSGALNQLNQTQANNVAGFANLQNPILGYLGSLFGENLQARETQAQLGVQAGQANASASAGKGGGALSGAGSVISTVLPIIAMAASDERLKKKITDTGMTSKEGVPLKTFEYKTRPGVLMLGVLSKDVKARVPSAVMKDERSGIEYVDTNQFPIFELSATRKAA